ncbi:MAG TPA: hydroxymethylbilane synthase [Vicinamibacteria bacterium]|jgi:hydroxymethylbilane synthase
MVRALRVGTRGSELALVQTRGIVASLKRKHPEINIQIQVIRTKGDLVTDVPLSQVGDRGLFIKELENALMDGSVDFAVHSMKDLPTELPTGLVVASVTERLDSRDVLITREARALAALPRNATLATGSLRRRSQALACRPDLQIVELRGNITTRLRKFGESTWDAMILASAGLARLGLAQRVATPIPTDQMLPAVGQGALGLEARADDAEVLECLRSLSDEGATAEVEAERALLRRLQGGCQVPIGARGRAVEHELMLEAYVGTIDGRRHLRREAAGTKEQARQLGEHLAETMLEDGASEILDETRSAAKGTLGNQGR